MALGWERQTVLEVCPAALQHLEAQAAKGIAAKATSVETEE